MESRKLFSRLPAVDLLLRAPAVRDVHALLPRRKLTELAGEVVDRHRRALLEQGEEAAAGITPEALAVELAAEARRWARPNLAPVINATGVILHTNLGRAPLHPEAVRAVAAVASGYSNLEFDLESGERGSRHSHVEKLLSDATGAEAAMVVNNNAAAVLLCLSALARGREVVVSRGELVEIGGSFRVPEVMAQSGAVLREVGTTNKTHLRDYEGAVTTDTALFLKVHTSNYRVVGFTEAVPAKELVALAHRLGLLLLEDLGSGFLVDVASATSSTSVAPAASAAQALDEPTVRESVAAGCDVVTFSGDKLLGGPQAGIIVGRREIIDQIRRHPLARAVRIDKMTLAALEATLRVYLDADPERAWREIPTLAMLAAPLADLDGRAHALAQGIAEKLATLQPADRDQAGDAHDPTALPVKIEVLPGSSQVGGGALPTIDLPTRLVAVSTAAVTVDSLARSLRCHTPPIVGRIQEGRLLFDVRTLLPGDDEQIVTALAAALAATKTEVRKIHDHD